jgi:hypothetical protein
MQQKSKVPWGYIVPALLILAVIIGIVYIEYRSPTVVAALPPSGPLNFPLTCLGQESLFLHIHPWLRIFVNGQRVVIPPAIGIKNPVQESGGFWTGGANSCFEPVHTHDDSGVIHIESPTNTNYTLGDFFDIWSQTYAWANVSNAHRQIVFSSNDLFGFTTNSTSTLSVLVDGVKSSQTTGLVLNTLDYCNAQNSGSSSSPCYQSAQGNPAWNGGTGYPYGTGHTIVIEFNSTA